MKNGAAIANSGNENIYSYLYIINCLFVNNYADHDGGAVNIHWGYCEIYNSTFKYNTAFRNGGALKNGASSITKLYDCIFENNHATEWGGAIYDWPAHTKPGNIELYSCIINNNTCGVYGGGIYFAGPAIIKNSTITNNIAGIYGGAIAIKESSVATTKPEIVGNLIYDNIAKNHYQDIYIEASTTKNLLDNNYWGTDNPINGSNYPYTWSERVNKFGNISTINIWLTFEEISKQPSTNSNNTFESKNNITTSEIIETTHSINNNSQENIVKLNIDNTNIPLKNPYNIKKTNNQNKTTNEEKTMKNTEKEISSNIYYIFLIVAVLLITIYGYKYKNK